MKTHIFKIVIYLCVLVAVFSCQKNTDDSNLISIKKERVKGYVQKGPFINGTSIIMSELTEELNQTGRNFNSQILDNKGTFEIENIELSSEFVELKATGFYYNEVRGENSTAQLTLYALTDLSDSSRINVNVLSHLEKNRMDYLISNGSTFDDAKHQAQQEILNIFNINKPDIGSSEYLDITQEGEDNAILLAISIILQGYRNDAELSELLANLSTDIREDGELNSNSIGTALINQAVYLNFNEIRQNLMNKYEAMGVFFQPSDFELYVNQFIDSTDFEFTNSIIYPKQVYVPIIGDYKNNLLVQDTVLSFSYMTGDYYPIAVYIPHGGSVEIIERTIGVHFIETVGLENTYPPGSWEVTYSVFGEITDTTYFERTYSSQITGDTIYTVFGPGNSGPSEVFFDIYENQSDSISKTIKITIE